MWYAFIVLIENIISLINLGLMIWFALDILMAFDIINRYNPLVRRIHTMLAQIYEPLLAPIRRVLHKLIPNVRGLDLSPIVLILLLRFVVNVLEHCC